MLAALHHVIVVRLVLHQLKRGHNVRVLDPAHKIKLCLQLSQQLFTFLYILLAHSLYRIKNT